MVFIILLIVFGAVGVYLLAYSKMKSASLKAFAFNRGLSYKEKDYGTLAKELNEKFGIEEYGRIRSFAQIGDLVSDGEVTLLRCTELLDMNLYRKAAVTHSSRFAVIFIVPETVKLFFKIDDKGKYYYIEPTDKDVAQDEHFIKIKPVLDSHLPQHWLSATFSNGRAIIYLMPLVVGNEKEEDFEYLFKTAGEIKKALSK